MGPFKIDTIKPTLTLVSINGGDTHTYSLNASVKLTASDAHSGLGQMQFSLNGANWGPGRSIRMRSSASISATRPLAGARVRV